MSKITLTTIKKFIRDNATKLHVRCESSFDGMTDCVESREGGFAAVDSSKIDMKKEQDLGIEGLWFVRESRDSFEEYNRDGYKGYRIFNSCGSSVIAIKS